jgi:oligopeptide/dipeptide ABC transporter ATP-binding protein
VDKFAVYWDRDRLHIDRIVYQPIVDATVRLANLKSGSLYLIERLLATDIKEARADSRIKLNAIPVPRARARRERTILPGDVPSPIDPPPGCHLHLRCPHAIERCRIERPVLIDEAGHATACHRWPELPRPAVLPAGEARSPALERLIGAFAGRAADVRAAAGVDTVEPLREGRSP